MQIAAAAGAASIGLKRPKGPSMQVPLPGTSHGFNVGQQLLDSFRLDLGLSGRKTQRAKNILKNFGAKCEKYLDQGIFKTNHILDDFFDVREISFLCPEVYEDSESERSQEAGENSRFVVICNNVKGLIEFLSPSIQQT